jgi:hypothetical protein
VPTSIAMRIGAVPEKRLSKAFGLVGMRLSSITSPFSLSSRHVSVAVTEIDAGGNAVVLGYGRSPPSFVSPPETYDSERVW